MRKLFYILLFIFPAMMSGQDEVSITNGRITVRQDLSRGGAISFISGGGSNRNLVNIYDEGRYIQQSYYAGCKVNRIGAGQSPSWSPWNWNPIQGGNFARCRARILNHNVTDSTIYVSCVPMLWDMDNAEADAVMEQWTEIEGNVIKVRNRIAIDSIPDIYRPYRANDQEIPAVYPISSLNILHTYIGDRPWTGEKTVTPEVIELKENMKDSFWGRYPDIPEKWMAFTDKSGFGMGIYSPRATRFLAGRYTSDTTGGDKSLSTSYIAPLTTMKLRPGSVCEYDYYIILGDIGEIRKEIYRIHKKENNINH